jgi:hypothetical protein
MTGEQGTAAGVDPLGAAYEAVNADMPSDGEVGTAREVIAECSLTGDADRR